MRCYVLQGARLKTYMVLLQSRLTTQPELEPSLVETCIGEDEEGINLNNHAVIISPAPKKAIVQRSISDRYSYRAAIYQNDKVDLDVIWNNLCTMYIVYEWSEIDLRFMPWLYKGIFWVYLRTLWFRQGIYFLEEIEFRSDPKTGSFSSIFIYLIIWKIQKENLEKAQKSGSWKQIHTKA